MPQPRELFIDNAPDVYSWPGTFCQEFPRIDVILNMNVTTRRWVRGCIKNGRSGFENKTCLRLDELPSFLHRKHWLIRDLLSKGGHQFVLMVGRNFKLGDHRALGFHHLESPEGRAILAAVEGPQETLAGPEMPEAEA